MVLARKSIKQTFQPSAQISPLMETFRQMTNDCIRIGIEIEKERRGNQTPSMKELSRRSYGELRVRYDCYSKYTLCAISKAAGILASRAKSIKRGYRPRSPYISKPFLVCCYDLKIKDGKLMVRLDAGRFEAIPLNSHTRSFLSDCELRVRSFTLSEKSISLSVSKEVDARREEETTGTVGVDRNLQKPRRRKCADGDVLRHDQGVSIGENTRNIMKSFTRSDVRIMKKIASKYGKRKSDRTRQLLNLVSKRMVEDAKAKSHAIVFEDISGIRKLYRRGNGQGSCFQGTDELVALPRDQEADRVQGGVGRSAGNHAHQGARREEPRWTVHDAGRDSKCQSEAISEHYRQLWCETCRRWSDTRPGRGPEHLPQGVVEVRPFTKEGRRGK